MIWGSGQDSSGKGGTRLLSAEPVVRRAPKPQRATAARPARMPPARSVPPMAAPKSAKKKSDMASWYASLNAIAQASTALVFGSSQQTEQHPDERTAHRVLRAYAVGTGSRVGHLPRLQPGGGWK